jgi:flagellar M-ring protein FliF
MIEQLSTLVRQLTTSQRIGIVFGALFSVLLLVGLVMWAGTPQMVPAFRDLATADAETVTAALDGAGIPYEIADGGHTIKVPNPQVGAANIAAGSAGYAADGATSGWSLFDKQGFGASEFDQTVAYQRALQGTLTTQIKGLSGVSDATVTIVAQDKGVLTSTDQAASASVYLKMKGGITPDDALVQAVAGLVAGAVAGLTPQNVTIVDASGAVLWGPNNASSAALTIQGTIERSYAAKIQGYLASVLGVGKSQVAVTADLDLDQVARTVTQYATGDGNTPSSVQYNGEAYGTGAAAGAAGVTGAISNIPGLLPVYPGASASPAPSASVAPDYRKDGVTVNYANTQTVSQIVQTPGAMKRLSVAVLVDSKAMADAGITADTDLATMVAAASGAITDKADPLFRGDTIVVKPVTFPAAAAALATGPDIMSMVGGAVPTVAGVILALVLLFLVWRNMRALRGRAEDMTLLAHRMSMPQLGAGERALAGAEGGSFREAEVAEFPVLNSPQAKVAERIRLMADDRPEELANLVQTWLHEDEKPKRR